MDNGQWTMDNGQWTMDPTTQHTVTTARYPCFRLFSIIFFFFFSSSSCSSSSIFSRKRILPVDNTYMGSWGRLQRLGQLRTARKALMALQFRWFFLYQWREEGRKQTRQGAASNYAVPSCHVMDTFYITSLPWPVGAGCCFCLELIALKSSACSHVIVVPVARG
jgi:hypothetical protein